MSRSQNAKALIEQRQKRELFMEQFNASQAVAARQSLATNWNAKAEQKVKQKDLFTHLDRIQAQHNDALVGRRQRLAALLMQEQQMYDEMLSNLTETDEQRRERIIRKARELKAGREEDRKKDNDVRNEQLLREKIDCLRQAESRLRVMQVSDERYAQLDTKAEVRALEKEEEKFFLDQKAEAQRLASERAQRDLEDRYTRSERLKGDLAAQVEGNKMRREMEKAEMQRETEEFNRLLHEERVEEARKAMQRRQARENLAREMKELNDELLRVRKEEYDKLRQEDKEELDLVLAAIAEEEAARKAEKARELQKKKEAMQDIQRQMAQKKDDDHALDKMWEDANNREWEKREAQWRADKKKRDQLLRNILIGRRQQVLDKRQAEKDEAEARRREDAEFLAALQVDDGKEAEAARKRLDVQRETQRYLDMQISQRLAEKEREKEEKRTALTDAEEVERQNDERIRRELAALDAAKPERYRNVPLLPPRSRNQPF